MKTFIKDIKDIQPSQLYISREKLYKVEKYLDSVDIKNIDPLPIKKIGENIFFTDGHTRAFALMKKSINEINVYWDEDDLDWLQYMICVDWCNKEGIKNISDLRNRVLNSVDYQKLWLDRCKSMQEKFKNNFECYIHVKMVSKETEKSDISEMILRSLPKWFGIEKSIKEYVNGVKNKVFLSAYVGEIPIGFLSIKSHNKFTSEIYVLGILKEFHGRGIGKILVKTTEDMLIKQSKKFLTVKTLGDSHSDKNYKKTRKFYRTIGFYPLEEFTEIWGKQSPCLLMIKTLN